MSVIVLTPPASRRLTTVENVRRDLGLGSAPADAQIERHIAAASSRAASYCNRVFGRHTVRERISLPDAGRGESVVLGRSPVARIVSVTQDGALLDPGQYETDGLSLFLLSAGRRSPWPGRELDVVYEAGWVLPGEDPAAAPGRAEPLPAEIERAVILLVGSAISTSTRDPMLKSEQVEGIGQRDWYVQGASAALPLPEAEEALKPYRRVTFA
ncbi:hypothetical protein [Methylobacterium nodulans]|uniref:Phage gp6-like head-tail connector protein n=1 Tax=Methylobacterium nodulans (strain LMG 21967 / CNCM I-2342 / ORS 2060) TaxID=460265 RepID=B8IIN2_METNO|nr:hypothetical protein [Methylobacterium nodulans]ACL59909.1 conserved hypothetical protein [Methylobacterium nodulans ORS 2060]